MSNLNSKQTVLIVGSTADALLNFRLPLIKAFLSKGYIVHAAAPDFDSNSTAFSVLQSIACTPHQYSLTRTGTNPLHDFVTFLSLLRLMSVIKPTVVFSYTIKPVIYGMIAAKMVGTSHKFALITGLGYAFQGDRQRRWVQLLAQCLYKIAIKCTDKVFFQNPDDQLLFKSKQLLGNTPSVVVNGSGVDLSHYVAKALPKGKITFLMVARLLGDKGVREYALAAIEIKKQYPDIQFNLAGWIDSNPNAINQTELDGWVKCGAINYLGKLADVRPALEDCHVFTLPSYREGTPRSVLEAMAVGRAIITTDAPGCKETVKHGLNGYLVPAKDSLALEQAMLKIIDSPQVIPTMGNESLKFVRDKYDVRAVNAHMLHEMKI